ncbi:MAG: hypothetical protein MZV70_52255 [Desulfobacterales bacterium]|nr:hypothetical protein [Desulfobacterales bacterium]
MSISRDTFDPAQELQAGPLPPGPRPARLGAERAAGHRQLTSAGSSRDIAVQGGRDLSAASA